MSLSLSLYLWFSLCSVCSYFCDCFVCLGFTACLCGDLFLKIFCASRSYVRPGCSTTIHIYTQIKLFEVFNKLWFWGPKETVLGSRKPSSNLFTINKSKQSVTTECYLSFVLLKIYEFCRHRTHMWDTSQGTSASDIMTHSQGTHCYTMYEVI